MSRRRRLVATFSALAISTVVLQTVGPSPAQAGSWKRFGSVETTSSSLQGTGAARRLKTKVSPSPSPSPSPVVETVVEPVVETVVETVVEPSPTVSPAEPGGTLWGLHQDLTWDGHAWRRAIAEDVAVQLGTQVSRNSLLWSQVEPVRGQRDWTRVDAVLAELRARGIKPLLVPVGSPAWANGVDPSVAGAQYHVPVSDAAFDAWARQFADFVGAAAARYRGEVPFWEIWNEQNQPFFWKPTPDPERYATLFRYTAAAISAADPAAVSSIGGLVGITAGPTWEPVRPGGWDGHGGGMEFLRRTVAAGAVPAAVALHPYSNGDPTLQHQWDNSFSDIGKVHDWLVASGRPATDLWVTEWGWNTKYFSDATVSRYVKDSVGMIRTHFPYVRLATYFKDVDTEEYQWGLADVNGTLKGAAAAWRNAIA